MKFNREKFKALVHFVCRECRDPKKLSKTKLHKILWLSDIQNYQLRAEPLTGERYIKMQYGPCAHHLDSILENLRTDGLLHIQKAQFEQDGEEREKFEFYAKGEPDLSLFTDKELNTIRNQLDLVANLHTAETISDRSHDDIWEMAVMREEIPYEAYLVRRFATPTADDFAWAKAEIAKL